VPALLSYLVSQQAKVPRSAQRNVTAGKRSAQA